MSNDTRTLQTPAHGYVVSDPMPEPGYRILEGTGRRREVKAGYAHSDTRDRTNTSSSTTTASPTLDPDPQQLLSDARAKRTGGVVVLGPMGRTLGGIARVIESTVTTRGGGANGS
jgi:hypothetical protein